MFVCPECGHRQQAPGFCTEDGVSLADAGDDVLLGSTLGSYRVTALIGRGGMGLVYRAVHPTIGSRVAVKVLTRECAADRTLVERFFAEARAVNLIRHDNIVSVLDLASLPDGRPFIVMELLEGRPLSTLIERSGPLPLGAAITIVSELLDGLSAAHDKGIVHRDLKPDNVYITRSGRVKVVDFGIAKLRPEQGGVSDATRTGSLMGTPFYMSPEQAVGAPVDARSDLYAVGVILFEMVTGQRPFSARNLYELLKAHVEAMPLAPRVLRADIPEQLETVLLHALQKDPGYRYQSARDFKAGLLQASAAVPPGSFVPPATLVDGAATSALGSAPYATPPPGFTSGAVAHTPLGSRPGLPTPQAGEAPTRRAGRFGYFAVATCGVVVLATLGSCVTCFGLTLSHEPRTVDVQLGGTDRVTITPSNFEFTTFTGHAESAAQKQDSSARLSSIRATGRLHDRGIDLTHGGVARVVYGFRTPSGCLDVEVTQAGLTTRRSDQCSPGTVGQPRCTVRQLLQRVEQRGGSLGNDASAALTTRDQGPASWTLQSGGREYAFDDDC